MKVGLIGLGVIGSRVAANLEKAGLLNTVYNRTHSKAEELEARSGVRASRDLGEVVRQCDVIVTVLSDDSAVGEVYEKLLADAGPGKTFLDLSTISPSVSVELAGRLSRKGASMLDVPVVGSAGMVERKEAVLLVGGRDDDLERVLPILQSTSKDVVHVGANGSGLRLKLVHNLALGSYIVALSEAVHFGLASGLAPELLERLFVSLSSVRSPNSAIKVPKILKADYSTQFSLKHMIKDLELIEGEARRLDAVMPLGSLALQLYRLAERQGLAEQDYVSVAEFFRVKKGR